MIFFLCPGYKRYRVRIRIKKFITILNATKMFLSYWKYDPGSSWSRIWIFFLPGSADRIRIYWKMRCTDIAVAYLCHHV